MADFIARIRAELDTSQAQAKLRQLSSSQHVIPVKIQLDTSSIDGLLRNIGGSGNGGFNQSFSRLGQQAGRTFSDNFFMQYRRMRQRAAQLQRENPAMDKWLPQSRSLYQQAAKAEIAEMNRVQKQREAYEQQWQRMLANRRQQEVAQVASYTKDFNNGKFSADSAVMSNKLNDYAGQTSEALSRARAAAEEYKTIMNELSQNYVQNKGFNFDDATVVNKFRQMEDAADKYKNAMREVGAESTKSLGRFEATTESNKILQYYNQNTKAAKKYGDQLKELAERMRNATTVGEKQSILAEFKDVRAAISAEGLTGKSIFDQIGQGFQKIGKFVGTYRLIMETVRAVKQMVTEVTNVDSALIELRKVSDASDIEISQSFEAATESARKYGVAISDVINSQADWARLGYGVKEAQQLADVTTLFQTVGDNMTQETASQGLISILKGYQMDVSQAESIVDKLNEVAKKVG